MQTLGRVHPNTEYILHCIQHPYRDINHPKDGNQSIKAFIDYATKYYFTELVWCHINNQLFGPNSCESADVPRKELLHLNEHNNNILFLGALPLKVASGYAKSGAFCLM